MIIPQNQWKTNSYRHYLRERPFILRELKDILFTCKKKIVFMSRTEIVPIFLRMRHEKRCFLWNLFLRSQCFNKILSTKSKKEDIYGINLMSFLSRNLFCKSIYTLPSFITLGSVVGSRRNF